MKRISIYLVLSLMMSGASLAGGGGIKEEKVITWSASQDYSSIVVKDNINVILVEGSSKTITIEGQDDLVEAIRFEVKKGELRVTSSRRLSGKITVVIPVNNLQKLSVRGSSSVTSNELTSSPKIKVKISGDGKVSLKTTGLVVVDGDENHDYIYNSNKQVEVINKH